MTRYSSFEGNSEVMDVLFCIIKGNSSVKSIMKTLKQPQSTISTKLQFLRKNGIVTKNKWKFDVNWKNLDKVFFKAMKNWIGLVDLGDFKKPNYFMKLFDDERIENILRTYAEICLNNVRKSIALEVDMIKGKGSIMDMTYDYLLGLCQTEDRILSKIDRRFIELKKYLAMQSLQKSLFAKIEGV